MWIELHDSARDHPKTIKLARACGIQKVHAFGHLCALWTWVLRMAPDGDMSSFDEGDIEIGAEWEGEPGKFVAACVKFGLIDKSPYGLVIHDWEDFSGSLKAAQRARDYRKRKRDSHVTVTSQCGDITQTERPERPKDRKERPSQFKSSAPPPREELPKASEQDYFAVREYADKLWSRSTKGCINHNDDFWRVMQALEEYGVDGCKAIVRGHKVKNADSGFEQLRYAFPWVSDDKSKVDFERLATYARAGGGKQKVTGPNMTDMSSKPSEESKRMQEDADKKVKAELEAAGIDPTDKAAVAEFYGGAKFMRLAGVK